MFRFFFFFRFLGLEVTVVSACGWFGFEEWGDIYQRWFSPICRFHGSGQWEGSSCWQPFIFPGYTCCAAKYTSPFVKKTKERRAILLDFDFYARSVDFFYITNQLEIILDTTFKVVFVKVNKLVVHMWLDDIVKIFTPSIDSNFNSLYWTLLLLLLLIYVAFSCKLGLIQMCFSTFM